MSVTLSRASLYAALTAATLLVHGYHPFAEDGGLYAAGVEYLLNPRLFPSGTAFVTEHLGISIFAPTLQLFLRLTHLALPSGLLLFYLLSTFLLFWAADRVLRETAPPPGRLGGLLLLSAWWTLPIAGTSLFLEDPYLTARSFSTALSLFALSFALPLVAPPSNLADSKPSRFKSLAACILLFALSALFHPLMTGYALGFLFCVLATQSRRAERWSLALLLAALALAGTLQEHARAESPAALAADLSRYYWFLSRWQWFELLGLAGPLLILLALLILARRKAFLNPAGQALCRASLLLGAIAILTTAVFTHTGSSAHPVARLQPLRSFAMIYLVMTLLLGSSVASWWLSLVSRRDLSAIVKAVPAALIALLAFIMFSVQRVEFGQSDHLELPWHFDHSPNPWVQAFLWARHHTPNDALFALDAHYIADSDAETFRAIAQRSALPDFSKDGGEASITPALAPAWYAGSTAQAGLNTMTDAQRLTRLQPFGVDWLILPTSAVTHFPCPYRNTAVQVCRLLPATEISVIPEISVSPRSP